MLKVYGIKTIVDVRTIPKSHHNPQFNQENVRSYLKNSGIEYRHLTKLGGLRHAKKDSINLGWRNASFRGYADYMATADFTSGLKRLKTIAERSKTTIMCAEAVPWRCHRSLIADALTKDKWTVYDIMSSTSAPKHKLTPFLKIKNGQLIYPAPKP